MAAAARHPNYLTQGLWPIAPLAQPNLLRLGESLPVEWRAGKTLFARRLARAGFSPALTHPDQTGNVRPRNDLGHPHPRAAPAAPQA
jgi:asparagine synthase (glutamine-hydrolysing)